VQWQYFKTHYFGSQFHAMSTIRVNTNFNIDVEFPAAPFHRRLGAWLIDVVVLVFYCILAFKLVSLARGNTGSSGETSWIITMMVLLPVIGYHLICEVVMNGQSVGKRIMDLRVVTEDGGRPSVGQFVIRWFIRTSDYMVILIAIAAPLGFGGDVQFFWQIAASFCLLLTDIVLVNASKKGQRLGDILAHTMMIRSAQKADINSTIFLAVHDTYTPSFPQVMALSDRDINALKGILDAAIKHGDYNLADRAAVKIKNHLKIETELSPFDFLEVLMKDYNYLSAN
jgi:uncharacterized RDD family membrane protein YckC